jgi:hypothetical protein
VKDRDYEVKRPSFNGTCLETAELKYKMMKEQGYNPEIVILYLHYNVEYFMGATSPLHAVVVEDDLIYDNGFISTIPFDRKYLERYGREVPDSWSDYRSNK